MKKDMIRTRTRTRTRIRKTYQVHGVKGLIISSYWLAKMVHKELFKIPPEISVKGLKSCSEYLVRIPVWVALL